MAQCSMLALLLTLVLVAAVEPGSEEACHNSGATAEEPSHGSSLLQQARQSNAVKLAKAAAMGQSGDAVQLQPTSKHFASVAKEGCDESMTANGQDYRGCQDTTKNGATCQRWDKREPQRHRYSPTRYPNAGLEENYCRNPDGEPTIWCYVDASSPRWDWCEPVGFTPTTTTTTTVDCASAVEEVRSEDGGVSYRGCQTMTQTGKTCQRWDTMTPHKHSFTPEKYPELTMNYCRNPGNVEKTLWCYTTDRKPKWDYCWPLGHTTITTTLNCESAVEEVIGDGGSYRGCQWITRGGHRCQRWDEQEPHGHSITPERYPRGNLVSNYCRNPEGDPTIWCYTENPDVRYDWCDPIGIVKDCRDADVVRGNGTDYRGCMNMTINGMPCQQWDNRNRTEHPDADLNGNYCRNPSGGPTIWCYTDDYHWEFCASVDSDDDAHIFIGPYPNP